MPSFDVGDTVRVVGWSKFRDTTGRVVLRKMLPGKDGDRLFWGVEFGFDPGVLYYFGTGQLEREE